MLDHLTDRPDHLWSAPPKTEEPFSTPRAWHMLSDALHSFGPDVDEATLKVLAHGLLTPGHAVAFCGYAKIVRHAYGLEAILKGDARWPARPEDRDLLYYLADAFRGRLAKELPARKEHASEALRRTAYRAKSLLVQLVLGLESTVRQRRIAGAEDDVRLEVDVDLLLERFAHIDRRQDAEPFGLHRCGHPLHRLIKRQIERRAKSIRVL